MQAAVASFSTRELGSIVTQIDAVGTAGYDGIELADRVDDRGLGLLYHNHSHEFVDVDGRTGVDRLVDATSTVGLAGCVERARTAGVGWAIYEAWEPTDSLGPQRAVEPPRLRRLPTCQWNPSPIVASI